MGEKNPPSLWMALAVLSLEIVLCCNWNRLHCTLFPCSPTVLSDSGWYCIVLSYREVCRIVLHFIVLHYIVLHCLALCGIAGHCNLSCSRYILTRASLISACTHGLYACGVTWCTYSRKWLKPRLPTDLLQSHCAVTKVNGSISSQL